MKNIVCIIAILLTGSIVRAQVTSGKVIYNETIKMDIKLDGDMAQFADMLPKEQSSKKELYFTADESFYQNSEKPAKKEVAASEGNAQINIDMRMPEEKTYSDLKASRSIAQKDFMGRKFLVSGDNKHKWKMTDKQKDVLNYPCRQATMERDSELVTAWFAPGIPVTAGPADWLGLPGLVLEVEVGKNYKIEATSVEPGAVDKKNLVKPAGGKKVSKEEYEAMVTEKTKEMRQENGGGDGNVIIRVERH